MLTRTFTKEIKPAQATQAELLDLLCKTIAGNNTAYFDALLPQIEDLDADQGRALRCCVEHDRFAMAQKLFIRGVASTKTLKELERIVEQKYEIYKELPSGKDREALAEVIAARDAAARLKDWKETFQQDILPVLPLQKMQEIEAKIDALRTELAQATSPHRIKLEKPQLPTTPASSQVTKTPTTDLAP